jgi:gas vesicle protein
MILRDLLDLVSKEKRRQERVKAAQKFAVGMGVVAAVGVATGIIFAPKSGKETRADLKQKAINTLETIKDTFQKKSEMVKDSAADAAQEVSNVIKEVHGKTERVKKDIKDGYHEVTQDIDKTVENILNEPNKPVK